MLIAGGTGASYIFAVVLDLINKLHINSKVIIESVWVIKDQGKWISGSQDE